MEELNQIIEVEFEVKSLNQLLKKHWSFYKDYKDRWRDHISAKLARCRLRPVGMIEVEIIAYVSRLMDEDNFIGGTKPIPDTLISLGWILDDSTKLVKVVRRQEKAKYLGIKTVLETKKGKVFRKKKKVYDEKVVIKINGLYE